MPDIWKLLKPSPCAWAPEVAALLSFLVPWLLIKEEADGEEVFDLEPQAVFFSPFRALLRCHLLRKPSLTILPVRHAFPPQPLRSMTLLYTLPRMYCHLRSWGSILVCLPH